MGVITLQQAAQWCGGRIDEKYKDITFSVGVHPGFTHEGLEKILEGNYKFSYTAEDLKEVFFTPTFVKEIGESTINYNTFLCIFQKDSAFIPYRFPTTKQKAPYQA